MDDGPRESAATAQETAPRVQRSWVQWSAWVMLSAALLSAIAGSPVYVWGVYNDELGNLLFPGDDDVHQKLQIIALSSNIASCLPFAGIFYDSGKWGGPSNTMAVGAMFSFIGFFLLSRLSAGWDLSIGGSNLAPAVIFIFFGGHATAYIAAGVLPPAARGFPNNRGQTMGLVKAFFGLGATILLAFYYAFFEDDGDADVPGFLLFMSIMCPAQAIVIGYFMSEPAPVAASDTTVQWRFLYATAVTATIAVFHLVVALYRATVDPLSPTAAAVVLGFTLLLCAMLCLIPFRSGPLSTAGARGAAIPPAPAAAAAGGGGVAKAEQERQRAAERGSLLAPPLAAAGDGVAPPRADLPPSRACRTRSFQVLYVCCFAGFGSNIVAGNNIQQIFRAKGARMYPGHDEAKTDADVAVQLSVIFSCAGRMGLGYLSDRLVERGFSRWLFFGALLVGHAVAQVLLALPSSAAGGSLAFIYIGEVLISCVYGGSFALMPTICSELYGNGYLASNYAWQTTSIAFGSLLLNTVMASEVFKQHQTLDADDKWRCYGTACFATTHYVMAGLCTTAAALCVWMNRRSRRAAGTEVGYREVPGPAATELSSPDVASPDAAKLKV